jgi:hypothetical protein
MDLSFPCHTEVRLLNNFRMQSHDFKERLQDTARRMTTSRDYHSQYVDSC